MLKERILFSFLGILVTIIFLIFSNIYQLRLLYDKNYFPSEVKKSLTRELHITEEERDVPLELIKSAIYEIIPVLDQLPDGSEGYAEYLNALQDSQNVQALYGQLRSLTEAKLSKEDSIEDIGIDVRKDNVWYFYRTKTFTCSLIYMINGDINKRISIRKTSFFSDDVVLFSYESVNNGSVIKERKKYEVQGELYRDKEKIIKYITYRLLLGLVFANVLFAVYKKLIKKKTVINIENPDM